MNLQPRVLPSSRAARLVGLLLLGIPLPIGCAAPKPWLLGRWSSGPNDDYRFKPGHYSFVDDDGATRVEAKGTWTLDGSTLRLSPEWAKASSPINHGPAMDEMTEGLKVPRTIVANRLDDNTATLTFASGGTATFHRKPE